MKYLRDLLLFSAISVAASVASSASAGVVFADDFNAEGGGSSQLNYNSFANWNVLGGSQVDLVKNGDYSTTGSGLYVDLDGTSGPGQIFTKQAFAFNAGDLITLSFDLSGSQRSTANDNIYFGLYDASFNDRLNGNLQLGANNYPLGNLINTQSLGAFFNLAGNTPWLHTTYTFNVAQSGSAVIYFGSQSADNVGPLIDNVSLSISAVPEPARKSVV